MAKKRIILIVSGAVAVGIIILILSLVLSSKARIESFEIGLKYDTIQRKLDKNVYFEGLHFGPPGFKFIKFAAVFKSLQVDKFRVSKINNARKMIHFFLIASKNLKGSFSFSIVPK